MSESTLSLAYPEIAKALGRFVGYGGDSAEWTPDELDEIQGFMAAGLRQFYFPPLLPGQSKPHEWRFLRPTTTLATVAATADYDLPDSFGSICGDFTFASADCGLLPVKVTGEADIRKMRMSGGGEVASGFPRFAAIRPKTSTGSSGQRYEVMFYPTPDAVYTLSYQSTILPNMLTSSPGPYPLGGMAHAETILQSCIAMAELRKENEKGIEWQTFMERLAASVGADKSQAPAVLGYNGDGPGRSRAAAYRTPYVTYNGVLYDG
ncbi:MAG: hypothetical protein WC100_03390 [Sterolibacterium sp.]